MRRRYAPDRSDNLNGCLFAPDTDWTPCKSLPDLSGEKVLGIDIESKDPDLKSRGPGFIRGDARAVGVSVATSDRAWYLPIAHLGGGNMESDAVISFVGDLLKDPNRSIIGANLQYDLEGLESLGIQSHCRCIDVQVAEALIDENRKSYALESLAILRLGRGKDETILTEAASSFGVDKKGGLWKLPAKFVGPYAEFDALSAVHIFKEQLVDLQSQNLTEIFELEMRLLPILVRMRRRGILVDLGAAEKLNEDLKRQETDVRMRLHERIGYHIDEWSGPQIEKLCAKLQYQHPYTEKGNPSFTSEWLEESSERELNWIAQIRELNRMQNTFVENWIFKNQVRGRIHPEWRQIVSDDGGTRTGRMAAANPNPQQIPAAKYRMTGEPNPIGKSIRACFISDTGKWGKFDYSQQEPRILVHFAALCKYRGAEEMAQCYRDDRKFDCYKRMVELCGIDRRPAKDMYLARCYGMGKKKLSDKLGRSEAEAEEILRKFDEGVPFVRKIQETCENAAQQRGYVRTLLGRRKHFDKWIPADHWERKRNGQRVEGLNRETAESTWPDVRLIRDETRKALNACIQGSAADMTKAAIVALWEQEGVLPYMQVHDELGLPVESEEHGLKLRDVIEGCVETVVPIVSDMSIGRSWR